MFRFWTILLKIKMANVTAKIDQAHYATTLKSGLHQIIADEPLEEGGTDLGFSPDELLAAALSACTSITLRMYADRKAWPLESVEVDVNFERDAATRGGRIVLQHGSAHRALLSNHFMIPDQGELGAIDRDDAHAIVRTWRHPAPGERRAGTPRDRPRTS